MGETMPLVRAMAACGLALVTSAVATSDAEAQAFVGPQGGLGIGLDYSFGTSNAVVVSSDDKLKPYGTQLHTIELEAEYTPIDRLALSLSVPVMLIKYSGSMTGFAYPHSPAPGEWDDGEMHSTLQDGRVGARYQLLAEPFVLTPHAALTVPLADYETNGYAAVGRHLIQGHFGASVARTLDPVLPNLYIHAMYEFTLSQKSDAAPTTDEINQNRSDIAAQIGYFFLEGDLEINAAANWRLTHGGVDFEIDQWNMATDEQREFHDELLDEDFIFLGGGLGYALTPSVQLTAYTRFFITGQNTRDTMLFGLNAAWALL